MLFPGERSPSPGTAQHNHTNDTSILIKRVDSQGDEELFPWLAPLDTGQARGGGGVAPPPGAPRLASQHAPGASRGWWPSWPLEQAATACDSQAPASPRCTACQPAAGSWGDADGLLTAAGEYKTPPRPAPPHTQASPETTPGASSPCTSDDELAAMMPHLAHALASPSPSGTSSPAPGPAVPLPQPLPSTAALAEAPPVRRSPSPQEGYSAQELVHAVDFHCGMFANLKREVRVGCRLGWEQWLPAPRSRRLPPPPPLCCSSPAGHPPLLLPHPGGG